MGKPQERLSCDEKLRELGLLSLDKRRLSGDPVVAFQFLNRANKKVGKKVFKRSCSDMTKEG